MSLYDENLFQFAKMHEIKGQYPGDEWHFSGPWANEAMDIIDDWKTENFMRRRQEINIEPAVVIFTDTKPQTPRQAGQCYGLYDGDAVFVIAFDRGFVDSHGWDTIQKLMDQAFLGEKLHFYFPPNSSDPMPGLYGVPYMHFRTSDHSWTGTKMFQTLELAFQQVQ